MRFLIRWCHRGQWPYFRLQRQQLQQFSNKQLANMWAFICNINRSPADKTTQLIHEWIPYMSFLCNDWRMPSLTLSFANVCHVPFNASRIARWSVPPVGGTTTATGLMDSLLIDERGMGHVASCPAHYFNQVYHYDHHNVEWAVSSGITFAWQYAGVGIFVFPIAAPELMIATGINNTHT